MESRHVVIIICNHNQLQSITVFQVIVIYYPLTFCKVIIIEYVHQKSNRNHSYFSDYFSIVSYTVDPTTCRGLEIYCMYPMNYY